jgi:hypothetical protein
MILKCSPSMSPSRALGQLHVSKTHGSQLSFKRQTEEPYSCQMFFNLSAKKAEVMTTSPG